MDNQVTYAHIRNAVKAIGDNMETILRLIEGTDVGTSKWFCQEYAFVKDAGADLPDILATVQQWEEALCDNSPETELCPVCHKYTENCQCWLCVCGCTTKATEALCDYCAGDKRTHWANPPEVSYQLTARFKTERYLTPTEQMNLIHQVETQLIEPHQPTTDVRDLSPTEPVNYKTEGVIATISIQ